MAEKRDKFVIWSVLESLSEDQHKDIVLERKLVKKEKKYKLCKIRF